MVGRQFTFQMMNSNIGLRSHETVPLIQFNDTVDDARLLIGTYIQIVGTYDAGHITNSYWF